MIVKVNGKIIKLKSNATVAEMLGNLGTNPETIIVVRNGSVVHEKEKLKNGDKVEFVNVVSGG